MHYCKAIHDNYKQYNLFIDEEKTPSMNYMALEEDKNNRRDTKKKDMSILCSNLSDLTFTVEQRIDVDGNFKFSLRSKSFCPPPIFRYDSMGPTHRNSNLPIPIDEQSVSTPHFHRFTSDGYEIAYKTDALKDINQENALKDISICVYHFMQEAHIKYENFDLIPSPGQLPFEKGTDITDPLENIEFE